MNIRKIPPMHYPHRNLHFFLINPYANLDLKIFMRIRIPIWIFPFVVVISMPQEFNS